MSIKLAELALERLSSSVLSYLNFWSYLDVTAQRILLGKATHRIQTCLEFYRLLLSGELKHGDRVILNNFYVTEWIPRIPGGIAYLVETERLQTNEL
jgi:hypothetical protein